MSDVHHVHTRPSSPIMYTIMSDAPPTFRVDTLPSPARPSKPSKVRFKSKSPRSSESSSQRFPRSHTHDHNHHHHHHQYGHPRSRQRHSGSGGRPLSPNTAFRESLFDALADDEGAAFWEGVYGQPIHNYSPNVEKSDGKLERMTDEEYVTYVRGQMWEKSHAKIVEERKRREEKRNQERKRDGERKREDERRAWDAGVKEALKRGEERRRKGKWRSCWDSYVNGWRVEINPWGKSLKEQIVWPVESGMWKDVRSEEVERFFKNAPQLTTSTTREAVAVDLRTVLKVERVRWHPDKIQQRFKGQGMDVDESTMKTVTAVFQVIDRMWSQDRTRGTGK